MHGRGQSLHVLGGDSRHGDPSVARHVDALALQGGHVLRGHPAEAEHTDLVRHVGPAVTRQRLQLASQGRSHANDAVSHSFHFLVSQGLQLGISENGGHEKGAVQWRVGVSGSCNSFDLAFDGHLLLLAVAGETEASDSLAVQAHV